MPQSAILPLILGFGMRQLSRDALLDEKADVLCKLFQQFRVEELEPAPGFYSRVLDRIAAGQESACLPLTYTRFTFRLTVMCVLLTSLALLPMIRDEPVVTREYPSPILQLTSSRPEEQRDAVLALFLADSSLSSPKGSIRRIEDPTRP
jgi:hypothetical protein